MTNLSSCPICSGNDFRDFLVCKDYTTSNELFTLKKCKACSLTFTDPKPDQESIGKYYLSEKYISHTGGKKTVIDQIYLLARKIALTQKREIIQTRAQGNLILDFGCGTGEFLNEMKNNGWEIIGVEPSSSANLKATEKTKVKIHKELTSVDKEKIDVITLWHVLEHLHDLTETLNRFFNLLKESGTIFIAVPNLESHDARYYESFWAAYDVPRHLWHFNKENMKRLLENHGFQLIDILPMKMDSFYVSLLSEGYKNPKQAKVFSLLKAIYRGIISNFKAQRDNNYSSLIYIARK